MEKKKIQTLTQQLPVFLQP